MQKRRIGNTVHMGILIVLFMVLFLILLLSMPLIVEARARIGVRGAVVHGRVWLLGLVPIPVRLRIYLFEQPYFTLGIGKKRVFLLQKQRKQQKPPIAGVRLLRLGTRTTVGVEGEPAQAVLLAGTLAVLLAMLTTRVAESGSAGAALAKTSLFRITAGAQAIVSPPQLLFSIARRRIARRKAVNNTRKLKEKRTSYASC